MFRSSVNHHSGGAGLLVWRFRPMTYTGMVATVSKGPWLWDAAIHRGSCGACDPFFGPSRCIWASRVRATVACKMAGVADGCPSFGLAFHRLWQRFNVDCYRPETRLHQPRGNINCGVAYCRDRDRLITLGGLFTYFSKSAPAWSIEQLREAVDAAEAAKPCQIRIHERVLSPPAGALPR